MNRKHQPKSVQLQNNLTAMGLLKTKVNGFIAQLN